MSALDELSQAVAAVAAAAGPSIVAIGSRPRGSGVVIADGRVLTNAHNLRGEQATVRFEDGRTARGTAVGVDWDGDVAALDVDTAGAPAVAWSSVRPTVGTAVFAAAAAGSGLRVTFGFVSAVERAFRGPGGRPISGSIEHTAPLAPGSSGSALLDAGGALLALNTNRVGEGFYLALPADAALRVRVEALARGESPSPRPRLGIAVAPAHVARRLRRATGLPDRDGVLVREVEPGSPADRAGIALGDLVVAVAGAPTRDVDELHAALSAASFPLEVLLVRGADERTVTVEATPES